MANRSPLMSATATRPPPARESPAASRCPGGRGGLETLTGLLSGNARLDYRDINHEDRIGWREITAVGERTTLVSSDVPAASISERLREYPEDRLQSPVDRRQAEVVITEGGEVLPRAGTITDRPRSGVTERLDEVTTAFTGLVAEQDLTVSFGLAAFGLALLLGALHALAPGHGKTVMAAYLVGQRGSGRQAVQLGLTVAVTHTAGVLALGVLVSTTQAVAPERVYPYLGLVSGLLFAIIGGVLLVGAARRRNQPHDHHHHYVHPEPVTVAAGGAAVPTPGLLVP